MVDARASRRRAPRRPSGLRRERPSAAHRGRRNVRLRQELRGRAGARQERRRGGPRRTQHSSRPRGRCAGGERGRFNFRRRVRRRQIHAPRGFQRRGRWRCDRGRSVEAKGGGRFGGCGARGRRRGVDAHAPEGSGHLLSERGAADPQYPGQATRRALGEGDRAHEDRARGARLEDRDCVAARGRAERCEAPCEPGAVRGAVEGGDRRRRRRDSLGRRSRTVSHHRPVREAHAAE